MDEGAKPKRGRPSQGKRGTFTFRVTDTLRTRLTAAAEASHRPVSEEIERRLEQSFREEMIESSTAGALLSKLFRLMIGEVALIEQATGRQVEDHEPTRLAAQVAITNTVQHLLKVETPSGILLPDTPTRQELQKHHEFGTGVAMAFAGAPGLRISIEKAKLAAILETYDPQPADKDSVEDE